MHLGAGSRQSALFVVCRVAEVAIAEIAVAVVIVSIESN